MKNGLELIAEERESQVLKHGFGPERDAKYINLELQHAAIYAISGAYDQYPDNWDIEWKIRIKAKSEIQRLAVAGALIAAEIDRLQLAEQTQPPKA